MNYSCWFPWRGYHCCWCESQTWSMVSSTAAASNTRDTETCHFHLSYQESPGAEILPLRQRTTVKWYDRRNNWHLQVCRLSAHECSTLTYRPFKPWGAGGSYSAFGFKDTTTGVSILTQLTRQFPFWTTMMAACELKYRWLQTRAVNDL